MLTSRDNNGKVIGWMETYFGKDESLTVNVSRNVTTVARQDRTSGKWETKTLFGTPPVPGAFDEGKRR